MVGLRAAQVADILVTLGPRAHTYAKAARRAGMRTGQVFEFDDNAGVIEWLQKNLSKKDAVLLKGSHGLHMERILAELEVVS